ncbi:hypothetical protein GCM10010371_45910 [Streptomyces subrutilus]|uniref:Transposase n=1 Tax=Streptomyces subrutilus TaxID=36818 RepID=A0A918R108_9ACTN|nr:hypothetical protein GCM10010371_45910 [Streptomyces subrutilus]
MWASNAVTTGIHGEYPPQEQGHGPAVTCRRRLAAWNDAGAWDRLHLALLKKPDR